MMQVASCKVLYQGDKMGTKSIRLNDKLVYQAKSAALVQHRTVPNQLEYWASLGRMISSVVGMEDAFAIIHGLKKLRVEPPDTAPVESDAVFNSLEDDRKNKFADKPVTSAPFFFEASQKIPGLLDKVDTVTGERKTGKFADGEFVEVNE